MDKYLHRLSKIGVISLALALFVVIMGSISYVTEDGHAVMGPALDIEIQKTIIKSQTLSYSMYLCILSVVAFITKFALKRGEFNKVSNLLVRYGSRVTTRRVNTFK